MANHENLFSPIRIGNMTVKNRIVKAPQASRTFNPETNEVTDSTIDFYETIAAGGTGMIILAALLFMPTFPNWPFGGLYHDKFIPGMKRLTDAIHKHNCKIMAQPHHGGPVDGSLGQPISASSIGKEDLPADANLPTRGVTIAEIEEVKNSYIQSAVRAQKAGFDGVEIHSANGYFLLSFLSRIWNHRDDQYGFQNMENRTRLQCEIIRGIRKLCGNDFVIGIRMNAIEFGHPNAMTPEEAAEAAKCFETAGAQYISVTSYGYGKFHPELHYEAWDNAIKKDPSAAHAPMQYVPDYYAYPEPDDFMKPYATAYKTGLNVPATIVVKNHISVPVITVGRLDENSGEQLLKEGKADLIAFGRGLWADPEMPNKIREGRFQDILRCNRCATCESIGLGLRHCRVNPAYGRERELAIKPAQTKKKVLVIGGGPAGLEAARVLDLRGHIVTLIEKKSTLGGKLHLASMIKGTNFEDIDSLINYQTAQIDKSGVTVRLKTEATPELIAKINPDAVVIATGGIYKLPEEIPGIHNSNVQDANALSKKADLPLRLFGAKIISKLSEIALPGIGKNVAVIGGQIEGVQTAVFLAKRGKNVTLLVEGSETGRGIPYRYLRRIYPWLAKHNVKVVTDITYKEINKKGVTISHKDNHKETFACDSVMVHMSQHPNDKLFREVNGKFPEVYRIGSANGGEEALIVDALQQGRRIGISI